VQLIAIKGDEIEKSFEDQLTDLLNEHGGTPAGEIVLMLERTLCEMRVQEDEEAQGCGTYYFPTEDAQRTCDAGTVFPDTVGTSRP
jgi:hypothetical protein